MADEATAVIGNTLTEEADAKSVTRVQNKDVKPAPQREQLSSITSALYNRMLNPVPYQSTWQYPIPITRLHGYTDSLYRALINLLFPTQPVPPNTITIEVFSECVLHLFRSRVYYIMRNVLGYLPAPNLNYPLNRKIPRSLYRVLMGLGSVTLQQGAILACPVNLYPAPLTTAQLDQIATTQEAQRENVRAALEGQRAHHEQTAHDVVLEQSWAQFRDLVDNIQRKNAALVATLGPEISGNKWFTLGVFSANTDNIAIADDIIYIRHYDPDISEEEYLLASVVQYASDGTAHGNPEANNSWQSTNLYGTRDIIQRFHTTA